MAAASYIHPTVKVDPGELVDAVNDDIQSAYPDWTPVPFAPEQRWFAALAAEYSTGLQLITSVTSAITAAQGRLARIVQESAVPASSTVTVRAIDTAGHVLQAGAGLQGIADNGDVIPLETIQEAVIAPGTTLVSGVQVQVAIDGEIGNGLTGSVLPDDALTWLDTIVLDEPTSQGVDEEDDDEFEDRLSRRLGLQADAQIFPENIEQLILDVPGVGRCLVLNNLDPANPNVDTAGHVTACPTTALGENVSGGTRDAISLLMARVRVLNNVNHIINPTSNAITLKLTVAAYPQFIETAADDAKLQLLGWLSKARWGMPDADGDTVQWLISRHIRIGEVAHRVSQSEQIAYPVLDSIRINGGTSDIEMTGLVPLPSITAANIDVTVIARVP